VSIVKLPNLAKVGTINDKGPPVIGELCGEKEQGLCLHGNQW